VEELSADPAFVDSSVLRPFGEKAFTVATTPPVQDAKITLLEGSVRSGKTYAIHPKIIQLCAYPIRGWRVIFGVTKNTIYQNVLSTLFDIIGPDNYGYNRQSGELDLFGVPWLVIGAKDEGSEKMIRGLTVGAAVGDELTLIPRSFTMMLLNRMSVEGARLYATMNEDTPFHYVKTELIDNPGLKEKGDLRSVHFTLEDNPNLPAGYREYLESIYPVGSLYHQRFVLGLWVTGEGAIYKDCWSETLLYDNVPWTMSNGEPGLVAPPNLYHLNNQVERFVAVDCGVEHPQVYLDVIDDGRHYYIDREYVWDSSETHRQKTDRQYRDDLIEFLKPAQNAQVIVPPECASFEEELKQAGIWYCIADNEVLNGIKTVATAFARGLIRVHRRCTRLRRGNETYCWNPKSAQRGVEEPMKQKDDEVDAERYFAKTKIPNWRLAA
jgi:PBSX family phage terminase large subunit